MAAEGTLTPYPIPAQSGSVYANQSPGGVSTQVYHVVITSLSTFTAGTWLFPHYLSYTPTWAVVIPRLAENVAPTSSNGFGGFCAADTNATNLAVNLLTGTSLTYDVLYG